MQANALRFGMCLLWYFVRSEGAVSNSLLVCLLVDDDVAGTSAAFVQYFDIQNTQFKVLIWLVNALYLDGHILRNGIA
jgi:hypothetical protein